MPVLLRKKYPESTSGVDGEITRRLRKGESQTFLYVVPTKRKMRELQRKFLTEVPDGAAPGFNLFTFETLAAALNAIINPPRRVVGGAIQGVLMLEAIRSVEKELTYIRLRGRNHTLPQGTFQKILHVINYLKERGIYLPVLYEEVQHSEIGEHSKLADILKIYQAYEKLLGERFIDIPGILKAVNDRWVDGSGEERFRARYPDCNAIFVSGFDEFSDPELTMLYHCSEMKGVGTLVSFDYHPENDEVFGHLKENYEKLLGMGFHHESVFQQERSAFQAYVARRLFKNDHDGKRFAGEGTITIAAARDRTREVELVAKTIKRLAAARPGRDLSAICVSMYQPQIYTQLFREVFDRYGIPTNITDRYSLHQSPLIISIMSLLALPERNFQLAGIMRALSTPYLRPGSQRAPLDAGNIYGVASLLKISGDRGNWIRRIDQRLETLRAELQTIDDDFEAPALRREEEMLIKARSDLAGIFSLLKRFDAPMKPEEFKKHLLAMLDELQIVESLLEDRGRAIEEIEVDTRAYQKFIAFIDDFLEILAMEGKQNERQPLSFYGDRLRQAVAQERFNVRQKYGYGVNVTSFDETRGLNFEVMFLVGLIDGEFPPVYQPEIFLSAWRRERRERYHLQEQRYLFYQALSNFSEHLYITLPVTVDEKETVPSSFLDALQEIVAIGGNNNSLAEITSHGIYSKDELHRHAGELIGEAGGGLVPDHERAMIMAELGEEFNYMRLAINVERSRMTGTSMPEYNGIIGGNCSSGARTMLGNFRQRVYSVTQLESYGKCPFQFFADRVLRLKVIEEPEEGLTPIERGDLLHEILFEFYSARRENTKVPLAGASDEEFRSANEELSAIARRKLEEINVAEIFRDIDNESILGSHRRKGILREFLLHERARETKTSPEYFEAAFGSRVDSTRRVDPKFTHAEAIPAGNVQLRGKIDRIELGPGYFSIVDYKTGNKGNLPGRKEINLGISLQLPLYLFAVEKILSRELNTAVRPGAGSYYTLKSPVEETLGIGSAERNGSAFPRAMKSAKLVADDAALREVIDQAVAFVNDYVDTIAKGNFPVEPKDSRRVCRYCDFQTACRIQTRLPVEHRRSGEADKNS